MGTVSVVVLDSRIAHGDQGTWAFADGEDAKAVAGFLNARVGRGEEIALRQNRPIPVPPPEKALRYQECVAELGEEAQREDEEGVEWRASAVGVAVVGGLIGRTETIESRNGTPCREGGRRVTRSRRVRALNARGRRTCPRTWTTSEW